MAIFSCPFSQVLAHVFGGLVAVVGMLVLILAKDWAGILLLAMGGGFIWLGQATPRLEARRKARMASASETPMKVEQFERWRWFDYAIVLGVGAVFAIIIHPGGSTTGAAIGFRILSLFGFGVFFAGIYHLTAHRLWARKYPHRYRRWVCSRCKTEVSEKASKCPKCGAKFKAQVH